MAHILAEADAQGKIDGDVSVDATINRAHQHGTHTTCPDQPTGGFSNHKNLPIYEIEPAGHGLGRPRGGLSTKIHDAADGNGGPLSIVINGGQRHDGAMLPAVLGDTRVPRLGPGGLAPAHGLCWLIEVIPQRPIATIYAHAESARSSRRSPTKSPPGNAKVVLVVDHQDSTQQPTQTATSLNAPFVW